MARLIVDDFIMLGRTFPQQTKNNGITVCACGYSPEMRQFLRIYPLQLTDKIPKWSICKLVLERPNTDSRVESWKIIDYQICGKANKDDEFNLLEKLKRPSINVLNELKLSLGVVAPKEIHCQLKPYNSKDESHQELVTQLNLFSKQFKLYIPPFIPYLQIVNEDNSINNLQIRDWGISEFLRKGNNPNDIFSALKLNSLEYKHLLVVGNMKQFRNNWLVISTVYTKSKAIELTSLISSNQLNLFSA